MDRIEDSFDTASSQESRLLLAALNTISELQRVVKNDDLRRPGCAQTSESSCVDNRTKSRHLCIPGHQLENQSLDCGGRYNKRGSRFL